VGTVVTLSVDDLWGSELVLVGVGSAGTSAGVG
jgi:hypothetical protein